MNKKEYTIKINGLTSSVKDVTKLEDALNSLDKAAVKTSEITVKTAATSKTKAKALTDEEKAAKKLADTQKRITDVNSEANKAQIEANQQLREAQREITRKIALDQLAEGSIKAMGMQLTDLRNDYEALSEEERNNIAIGGQMITKIQALDAEYKELRESTGNFRDSVGNYEKALSGLDKLDKGLGDVSNTTNGLSNAFASNNALMGIFGSVTETTEAAQKELAKIIALVTLAQQLSTGATKEGIVATTAKTVVDKVSAIQIKAKAAAEALATKGTIAATIAQKAFNVVASANPYVLLALALVGVVGALAAFSDKTEDAAEAQNKLNNKQKIFLDYLDSEAASLKLVSDARVNALNRQLELSKAQGKSAKDTRKIEDDIYREKLLQNARLLGTYGQEVEALETNRKKLAIYYDMMRKVQLAKERGADKLNIDIDLNGKAEKMDVEKAVETLQGNIDGLNRKIQLAVELKTNEKDLLAESSLTKALREKEDKEAAKAAAEKAKQAQEEAKRKAEEARKNAQERAALELEAQRAAEDLKIKLMGQSYEAQRKIIITEYDRQKQDLQIRLKNEDKLTSKARKSINDQIVNLEKVKNQELDNLTVTRNEKELETLRQLEDQKTAFILGMEDRRRAEINTTYDRQIEDVKYRLQKEKDLTQAQREALNEMIIGYERQKQKELLDLAVEGANKTADIELKTVEYNLASAKSKIGDIIKRNKDKYGIASGIIDPEATRKAAAEANDALQEYIVGLEFYQVDLKKAYEKTLSTLKEGTPEYREEMLKYAQANEDAAAKIKAAQNSIAENNKTAGEAQITHTSEVLGKVSEYAQAAAEAINVVTSTLTSGLQASLDSLNEQLDVINEQYDEAKEKREKYAEDVENIEAQVRSAQGATSDAMKSQLQDAMHLRDEAAREEQRLQKEKEKKEAEIKKKEKQIKKAELISNMAMAAANVAEAVTKMLTAGPISGQILAGITAAMGAVQIGIMAKQLSKLEKGGPIVGPSHANGGVNIMIDGKPSYEAQGGEFMINDKSYSANKGLTEFLNASSQPLTAADLVGIVPGFDALPTAVNDIPSGANNSDVVDAINGMEFNPIVSVTDIIDVTDEVTTVRDLAGV